MQVLTSVVVLRLASGCVLLSLPPFFLLALLLSLFCGSVSLPGSQALSQGAAHCCRYSTPTLLELILSVPDSAHLERRLAGGSILTDNPQRSGSQNFLSLFSTGNEQLGLVLLT